MAIRGLSGPRDYPSFTTPLSLLTNNSSLFVWFAFFLPFERLIRLCGEFIRLLLTVRRFAGPLRFLSGL
jgi:hypothetical protein